MATAVFNPGHMPEYTLSVELQKRSRVVIEMGGDGLDDIVVQRNIPTSRNDLTGQQSVHGGRKVFTYQFSRLNYAGAAAFKTAWRFLIQKDDAGEAFYIYWPIENPNTSLWTGDTASGPDAQGRTNLTGRYLVILDPTSNLKASIEHLYLHSVQLTFVEVRA